MTKTTTKCYCDRCGKEMTENYTFYCFTYPKTAVRILRNEWQYADLCGECRKSFEAWWEKSSVSPTETESEDT